MGSSMRTQIDKAYADGYAQGLKEGGVRALLNVGKAVDGVLEHGGTGEQRSVLRAVKTVALLTADGIQNEVPAS